MTKKPDVQNGSTIAKGEIMNLLIGSKITKIKEKWLATSIAYLFSNNYFYWAPDSRSGCGKHIDQATKN